MLSSIHTLETSKIVKFCFLVMNPCWRFVHCGHGLKAKLMMFFPLSYLFPFLINLVNRGQTLVFHCLLKITCTFRNLYKVWAWWISSALTGSVLLTTTLIYLTMFLKFWEVNTCMEGNFCIPFLPLCPSQFYHIMTCSQLHDNTVDNKFMVSIYVESSTGA